MTHYFIETDLVRSAATELRRAANNVDEIAADIALALALCELESQAVRHAIALAERLDRAASDLRGHTLEIEHLDRTPLTPDHTIAISANRI